MSKTMTWKKGHFQKLVVLLPIATQHPGIPRLERGDIVLFDGEQLELVERYRENEGPSGELVGTHAPFLRGPVNLGWLVEATPEALETIRLEDEREAASLYELRKKQRLNPQKPKKAPIKRPVSPRRVRD